MTDETTRTVRGMPAWLRGLVMAAWNLVQIGIVFYGLGTISFLLARIVIGERWRAVAYANNFIPWMAWGALGLAAISLLARRRWLLIGLQAPIIASFLIIYGGLLLPRSDEVQAAGPTFSAATYNIISRASDPERVIEVIAAMDADIVGLQEVGPEHAEKIGAAFANEYPYQVWYPRLPVHGVGLLSRYPVREEEMFRTLRDSMLHLRAVVEIEGVPTTVFVVHPSPPRHVASPLTYNDQRRNIEIRILRERYFGVVSGPMLALGDFNMSDQSDSHHALRPLLTDSFREAGQGMGFTFPAKGTRLPPLIRIDYVWHSDHFVAHDARSWDDSGTSDHLPVRATLSLAP